MPSATRIIAVRHGETDWNVDTRIQGQLDVGLNARGRWQAEQAARALADEVFDAIYASDLSRARDTALAIAAGSNARSNLRFSDQSPAQPPVQVHTGLRERAFGKFEGHTYATIEALWPEEARLWHIREPHFAPSDGGESPAQILERVANTVNSLAGRHLGQQILLVTHGGVLDALYRLATRQSVNAPRTWQLGNAAINRLLWTPEGLTLVGWADTQHLDEVGMGEVGGEGSTK
ncbi:MAG: histidine phosphatase family protein [Rhodoferax sp.]|nr:histidine phosphatase family protein [Rhodoferax sp.]